MMEIVGKTTNGAVAEGVTVDWFTNTNYYDDVVNTAGTVTDYWDNLQESPSSAYITETPSFDAGTNASILTISKAADASAPTGATASMDLKTACNKTMAYSLFALIGGATNSGHYIKILFGNNTDGWTQALYITTVTGGLNQSVNIVKSNMFIVKNIDGTYKGIIQDFGETASVSLPNGCKLRMEGSVNCGTATTAGSITCYLYNLRSLR